MKTKLMLPLLLIPAAALITPASANWFHNPYENINRNVGSAPNPTPADVRADRLPIVTEDENTSGTTTAQAKPDAKTASTTTQGGGAGTIPAASPSR